MNTAIHGTRCTVQIVVVLNYETLCSWGKCNQFLIMKWKQEDRLAVMSSEGYKFKRTWIHVRKGIPITTRNKFGWNMIEEDRRRQNGTFMFINFSKWKNLVRSQCHYREDRGRITNDIICCFCYPQLNYSHHIGTLNFFLKVTMDFKLLPNSDVYVLWFQTDSFNRLNVS